MGLTISRIIEPYQVNPLRPQRPPISGNEGLQALQRAERIDGYLDRIDDSPINTLARLGQVYLSSAHSVSRIVPDADPAEPWPSGQVIWMDPSADAGLPHTRPPYYICISRDFPEADLKNTLLHERVHISQRIHPQIWNSIVEEAWNFKPWKGNLPADLESRRRINPDIFWTPMAIWKQRWVPFAIYRSSSKPKLNEIDVVWWDDSARVLLRVPPPGWLEFFGNIPAGEHPYEIAAYLVAANPKQNTAYKALQPRLKTIPLTDF